MERGKLYVVATPIGNLGDITRRAVETLGFVDCIAAEDTRRSGVLLGLLGIKKPLIGYYKGRERTRSLELLERLRGGENVALISDAGTPCVSDPGSLLVRLAREDGIDVLTIPGASAVTAAYSISGLDGGYAFLGFLPGKLKDRESKLSEVRSLSIPLIFYSAPHDVNRDLEFLYGKLGPRRALIMRELTKVFEETLSGSLDSLRMENPRGEFVLIVEGQTAETDGEARLEPLEELKRLLASGADEKEAVKAVSKKVGAPKDEIYKLLLGLKGKL